MKKYAVAVYPHGEDNKVEIIEAPNDLIAMVKAVSKK